MAFSPEKKAIIVSTSTAIFLTILKVTVGVLSGSMAVLSSATDSLLDFFVSLVNLFAIRKSENPADEKYHYGYGKIEGMGAMFEGMVITFSGLLIGFFAIKKLISGELMTELGASLGVMMISIVVTAVLVWYLSNIAKKSGNLIIKSDALHYKTDLYTNGGILISLAIIKFTGYLWIDSAVSIIISMYIIYSALGIMREGYHMLMDRALSHEEIDIIKEEINRERERNPRISGVHLLKTRSSGKTKYVEFHLVFDKEISLLHAHQSGDRIECQVGRRIP